ncbi:unnamed protein product [Brassica rapa subsp. narinosa]
MHTMNLVVYMIKLRIDMLVTMLKIRTAEIPRPQEYNYYKYNNVKFLSEEAAAASSLIDDLPLQYSPMSEDSDEARFCEDRTRTSSSQPESRPTSHVLPSRSGQSNVDGDERMRFKSMEEDNRAEDISHTQFIKKISRTRPTFTR